MRTQVHQGLFPEASDVFVQVTAQKQKFFCMEIHKQHTSLTRSYLADGTTRSRLFAEEERPHQNGSDAIPLLQAPYFFYMKRASKT